jgi:hypothetical protein
MFKNARTVAPPDEKKYLIATHAAKPSGQKQQPDIQHAFLRGKPCEDNEGLTFQRRPNKRNEIEEITVLADQVMNMLHSDEPLAGKGWRRMLTTQHSCY